ncbi:adipocyte plasma membrane-associated protein Hemomucin [Anoplolepis gracilipes]|uniref:adipocyte plasma membrane-associated protein Hemomucin n=1 Tax=Anoplolepis gracilipes TaxID=354296 RepID=UPI003B9FA97C
MSYLKSIGTAVIYIGLFLAIITFIPGLPPDSEFREFSPVPPRDYDSKKDTKNRLNNAQKLFEGRFLGPEALDSYDGQLYTSIYDGYVVRINEDDFVPVVKFGKKCDGIWQEQKCGRPLGLKFDKKGNLYVADAYYGIFKVNVTTGEYNNVVDISKPINGKVPLLPNSVAVAENGDLYWSSSSMDFTLYEIVYIFFTNPTGRLIRYNAAKKKNEVLLENLAVANGVLLSNDESFVLVVESTANRIIKYHLKGPKAGQHEIFIEGLPGIPDNLQSDGQGGFLVPIVITMNSEHPQLALILGPHPYLRKMIVRLLVMMKLPFKLLHDIYPTIFTEKVLHALGSYQGIGELFTSYKKSLMLRIDASGNIMEMLSSDDDIFNGISDAYIHNGFVWFGSPWRNYLARVPLKQAFPDLANSEKQSFRTRNENAAASNVKLERAKRDTISTSTSTTSKPTPTPTTTPKPIVASTTTAPKPSPTPKVDKPTTDSNNAKRSETKSTLKSENVEVKKNPETISNAKFESDNKKEDARKSSKVEQNASIKEKVEKSSPKKIKPEATRSRDDL